MDILVEASNFGVVSTGVSNAGGYYTLKLLPSLYTMKDDNTIDAHIISYGEKIVNEILSHKTEA